MHPDERTELLLALAEELDGMYYGSLSPDERKAVDLAVALGRVSITYKGAAGLLGLGKVEKTRWVTLR